MLKQGVVQEGSDRETVSSDSAELSDLPNLYFVRFLQPGRFSFQWAEFGGSPKEMHGAASV